MRASILGFLTALLLVSPVLSQRTVTEVPGLLELPGREAWVKYTPGSLDRAAHVQDWLKLLAVESVKATGEGLRLGAFVLDRDEWESTDVGAPYGVPRALGDGRLALPAYGDDGTVAFWRTYQPRGFPSLGGTPIRGTETEAASLFVADHLALLEMARQIAETGHTRGANAWIQELLAHGFLLQALRPEAEGRIRALDLFWGGIASAVPDPGPRPGYGAGLTFDQWLGHQAEFHALARSIEEREGRLPKIYDRFRKLARKNGGVLAEEALEKRYGELMDRVAGN